MQGCRVHAGLSVEFAQLSGAGTKVVEAAIGEMLMLVH